MSHIVVDTSTVRQAEIGYRADRGRGGSVPSESLMLTGDENIVEVQLFVQYMVQDPVKFLFGAEQPETALRASAEIALRGVVGENTIDYTMTEGRDEIQKKVESYLQKLMDNYDTGLLITQARLLVVDPPGQVKEAFHDVVRAWEDRERVMTEAQGFREDVVPKARGQAQQEIREAEAYKAQRVIRAQGRCAAFFVPSRGILQGPRSDQGTLVSGKCGAFPSCAKEDHHGWRRFQSVAAASAYRHRTPDYSRDRIGQDIRL